MTDAPRLLRLGTVAKLLTRRTLAIAVGAIVACELFLALQPQIFVSQLSVLPQARRGSSGLSAVAAQFGVAIPAGEAGQSPSFFAELARSRAVLVSIADTLIAHRAAGSSEALRGIPIPDGPEGSGRETLFRWLARQVTAVPNQRTGTVAVQVRMPSAGGALFVADRMVDELNRFNVETRKSQAREERRFTEDRLEVARDSLAVAENRARRFLEGNRDYSNSPRLALEFEQLQRNVLLAQQVYGSLAQGLEQARIEEVRETPVITVIDAPARPERPEGKGYVLFGIVAALGGLLLGAVLELGSARATAAPNSARDLM